MLSDPQFPHLNGKVIVSQGTLRAWVCQGQGQLAKSCHR